MPRGYPDEGQTPHQAARKCSISSRGHALTRQIERGIDDDAVRRAIRRGKRQRVEEIRESGEATYKWECRDQVAIVVFYLQPCRILLKTVMRS